MSWTIGDYLTLAGFLLAIGMLTTVVVVLVRDQICMTEFKYQDSVIIIDGFYQTEQNGKVLSSSKGTNFLVKLDNGDIVDVKCRSLGKTESVTA